MKTFLFCSLLSLSLSASSAYQTAFTQPEKVVENFDSNPKAKIKTVKSQCAVYPDFALITNFRAAAEGDRFAIRPRNKKETPEKICSSQFKGPSHTLANTGWFVGVKQNYLLFRDKGSGSINEMSIVDAKSGAKIFSDSYNEHQGIEFKPSADGNLGLNYFKGLHSECNPIHNSKCWTEIRAKNELPGNVQFDEKDCEKLMQSPAADSGPAHLSLSAPAQVPDLRNPKVQYSGGRIVCSPGI